ncbi:MAG: hypothetical protein JO316_13755 [Abitibacteriaceae bacterium]|nr:hypothetical protein [Abditibacteriaceae bacterium]
MNRISLLASLALVGIAAGCGSQQPEYVAVSAPATTAANPAPDSASGAVPGSVSGPTGGQATGIHPSGTIVMPPGMSVGTSGNLTPTPQLDARIKTLEKQGKDKKAIAAAYADRGYERMMDDPASPKIKYRAALQDFRTALKFDPSNEKAGRNKDMIESIYRSMHRPIPS